MNKLINSNEFTIISRVDLKTRLESEKYQQSNYCYLILDVDNLNILLELYGDANRSQIVARVYDAIDACNLRDYEIFKLGDNKFILLASYHKQLDEDLLLDGIMAFFNAPVLLDDSSPIWLTVSGGFCVYPRDANNAKEILNAGEYALNRSQVQGQHTIVKFHPSFKEQATRCQYVHQRLSRALMLDQIEVKFHPVIDPSTNEIAFCEVLARWTDDELGVVSPIEFIKNAEETGLIKSLGKAIFKKANQQITRLNKSLERPLMLSFNYSQKEMDFGVEPLIHLTKQLELDPKNIILEITETYFAKNPIRTQQQLSKLKETGFQIAMDDFGTGYSSLGNLKFYPFDIVKADRTFIRNMMTSKTDRVVVKAILDIAQSLNIKVVAEGVEEEEQLLLLSLMKADLIQGFIYCEPLDQFELCSFIEQNRYRKTPQNQKKESHFLKMLTQDRSSFILGNKAPKAC